MAWSNSLMRRLFVYSKEVKEEEPPVQGEEVTVPSERIEVDEKTKALYEAAAKEPLRRDLPMDLKLALHPNSAEDRQNEIALREPLHITKRFYCAVDRHIKCFGLDCYCSCHTFNTPLYKEVSYARRRLSR